MSGLNKWIHEQGFTYKKPKGIPHKFDADKQAEFVEHYIRERIVITVLALFVVTVLKRIPAVLILVMPCCQDRIIHPRTLVMVATQYIVLFDYQNGCRTSSKSKLSEAISYTLNQ